MFSPKRVSNALRFSFQGFKSAWQTEAAFRDNATMALLAQLSCLFFKPAWPLWLAFLGCNLILLMAELFNTGIEYLCDHISTDHHKLLGSAKDVGSAAVFCLLMLNAVVFGTIIWQYVQA